MNDVEGSSRQLSRVHRRERTTRSVLIALALAFAAMVATAEVDCTRREGMSKEDLGFCDAMRSVDEVEAFLLPVTPVSGIFRLAKQRVAQGDEALFGRVAAYEKRWTFAEASRVWANQAVLRDVMRLRRQHIEVTEDNYLRLVSADSRARLEEYLRAVEYLDAIWSVSAVERPSPKPLESAGAASGLLWTESSPGGAGDSSSSADIDAARKIGADREARAAEGDWRAAYAATMDSDALARRADEILDQVDGGSAPGGSGSGDDGGSGQGTPWNGTGAPPPPAPGPGGWGGPNPLPGPPGPDDVGGASPPPPLPPGGGNSGGPWPPPGLSPDLPPGSGSGGGAGGNCLSDSDFQSFQTALQQAVQNIDCAATARIACGFFQEMRQRCPSDYEELRRSWEAYGSNGQDFVTLICSPSFCSDGAGGADNSPGEHTVTGSELFPPCTKNEPFDCSDADGDVKSVCAAVPADAQVLNVEYYSQLTSENGGPCAPNTDCRWGKFLGPAYQKGDQVCADFLHWSSHLQRSVRVTVRYRVD